jgi:hypothetical protein
MITAGQIMDGAAALLNDSDLSSFTYAVQIPYLNIALEDLRQEMEINNIPCTNAVSTAIYIPVGTTGIGGDNQPALPQDLVEIQKVSERLHGTTDDFIQITKMEFLPETSVITEDLLYWAWVGQQIKFLGALTDRDVKIEYISAVIPDVVNEGSVIKVINAGLFLKYRTAALCAEYTGENKTRSDDLNLEAERALYKFLNLPTKGRQSIFVRRRPFRAAWKSRTAF